MTAGRASSIPSAPTRAARPPPAACSDPVWVALPQHAEDSAPDFAHHDAAALPLAEEAGLRLRLIAGQGWGLASPAAVASPLFYADAQLAPGARVPLPEGHEERGAYVVQGEVEVAGTRFESGRMLVFRAGDAWRWRRPARGAAAAARRRGDGRPRYLYWNFVASSPSGWNRQGGLEGRPLPQVCRRRPGIIPCPNGQGSAPKPTRLISRGRGHACPRRGCSRAAPPRCPPPEGSTLMGSRGRPDHASCPEKIINPTFYPTVLASRFTRHPHSRCFARPEFLHPGEIESTEFFLHIPRTARCGGSVARTWHSHRAGRFRAPGRASVRGSRGRKADPRPHPELPQDQSLAVAFEVLPSTPRPPPPACPARRRHPASRSRPARRAWSASPPGSAPAGQPAPRQGPGLRTSGASPPFCTPRPRSADRRCALRLAEDMRMTSIILTVMVSAKSAKANHPRSPPSARDRSPGTAGSQLIQQHLRRPWGWRPPLIGFLDGVGGDGREILHLVPGQPVCGSRSRAMTSSKRVRAARGSCGMAAPGVRVRRTRRAAAAGRQARAELRGPAAPHTPAASSAPRGAAAGDERRTEMGKAACDQSAPLGAAPRRHGA